jgi:opacity protein-like surface antigen
VLGFGPAGVAEVNARAARADDGTATFYNPGGLALGHGVAIEITPTVGVSALSAQRKTLPLTDPFGVSLAFAATIPLTGALKDRFRVGFGAYLPSSGAFHLTAHESDQPVFPYYDNRTQRLVLVPALAVRLADGLGVGVGLNVLGGVTGPATVDVGASGAPEPSLALAASTSLAVNAGVRFDPTPNARLALTVRQRFSGPAVVDSAAAIAGVPLDVTVATHAALFDPTTVVAAASFDLCSAAIELDASYAVWSAYEGPWVTVHATLPGVNVTSALPGSVARDVVSLRGAATYTIPVLARSEVVLRAGLGFEPSMLKRAEQGVQNLVDGDKVLGGLGATFALRVLPATLRFGLGANVQGVLPYAQDKRACASTPCPADTVGGPDAAHPAVGITNPGYPSLHGGGTFWSLALGIGAEL